MREIANEKRLRRFVRECPYCHGKMLKRDKKYVYGIVWGKNEWVWVCENYPRCSSYVGCHPNTDIPLGRVADHNLREWKKRTHRVFDVLWKSHHMSRRTAYVWLSEKLGIPQSDCHIGMFDEDLCRQAIKVCKCVDSPR